MLIELKTPLTRKTVVYSGADKEELKEYNRFHAKYFYQPCRRSGYIVYIDPNIWGTVKCFKCTSRRLTDAILLSVREAFTFVEENQRKLRVSSLAEALNLPNDSRSGPNQ